MPIDPQALSAHLKDAGESQKKTGKRLRQSSENLEVFGDFLNADGEVSTNIEAIKTGFVSIRALLLPIGDALTFIGETLGAIVVPVVSTTTTTIMGVSVITGVRIRSVRPFAATASRCTSIGARIVELRASLLVVSDSLGRLIDAMPAIQESIAASALELHKAGDDLEDGGSAMIEAGDALN